MIARVVQLQKNGFNATLVSSAVEALRRGALVVLPTETVYGIAVRADDAAAVEHLMAAKNRSEKNPFTLAFAGVDRILPYVPYMSVKAERLARRCFPGPITIVMTADFPESAIYQLPENSRQYVMPEDSIGVRVPRHDFTQAVLREADFPVALTSANLAGQVDSTSALEVVRAIGDKVDLIFDDGDSILKEPSTVLQFARNSNVYRILRQGAVSCKQLDRFAQPMILFVCTGNTCRSPMAEALAKDILARKRGVPLERFEETGIQVYSAGTCATDFSPASSEARHAMQALGLDLSAHISHPVTGKLLDYADLIYTMTPTHRLQILSAMPEIARKVFTLARTSGGISDPYGSSFEVYETCARQIRDELEKEFSSADFAQIVFPEDI